MRSCSIPPKHDRQEILRERKNKNREEKKQERGLLTVVNNTATETKNDFFCELDQHGLMVYNKRDAEFDRESITTDSWSKKVATQIIIENKIKNKTGMFMSFTVTSKDT